MLRKMWVGALAGALVAPVTLGGCVTQGTYNNMLQQQQAIESALRTEISADQVKIEQLENGIRVSMSNDLLFNSGSAELHPNGSRALDKVAPQLVSMASQGDQVDVIGNTDNEPIGPAIDRALPHELGSRGRSRVDRGAPSPGEGRRPDQDGGDLERPVSPGRVERHASRPRAEPSHGSPAATEELTRGDPPQPVATAWQIVELRASAAPGAFEELPVGISGLASMLLRSGARRFQP